jgi:septal ring-binding cell division protein DamX
MLLEGWTMKRRNCFLLVAVLFVCMSSSYAMSHRPKDQEDITDKKSISMASNEKNGGEAPATFLDTLNRGKEFSLSDRDFAAITTESTSVAGQKDVREDASSDGYRIQCFASSQIERVRAEQKQLETKIKYPLYIVFNAPYYKLLVGDFVKKNDAENAMAKLKEMGYGDCWVARSKIEPRH